MFKEKSYFNDIYPGFVEEGFSPFDPLELAKETEKIVCSNSKRKYTSFYCTGVYGGISTGYLVGCCLRCIFCWVEFSRESPYKYGQFFSPAEVFKELIFNAQRAKIKKLRVSGGEPTLGEKHLLELLDLVNQTDYFFILETNGILLGKDLDFVLELKKYRNLYIRVSLKAGTPEGFKMRTGAKPEFFELPFLAIRNLLNEGLYFRVASMSDPRLMPKEERKELVKRLKALGYFDYLEEEVCDPYNTTLIRLEKAGWKVFY